MKVIIYGSKYGTAKQYAEKLSEKTSIQSKSYKDIKDINSYETIIYRRPVCWWSFRNE